MRAKCAAVGKKGSILHAAMNETFSRFWRATDPGREFRLSVAYYRAIYSVVPHSVVSQHRLVARRGGGREVLSGRKDLQKTVLCGRKELQNCCDRCNLADRCNWNWLSLVNRRCSLFTSIVSSFDAAHQFTGYVSGESQQVLRCARGVPGLWPAVSIPVTMFVVSGTHGERCRC